MIFLFYAFYLWELITAEFIVESNLSIVEFNPFISDCIKCVLSAIPSIVDFIRFILLAIVLMAQSVPEYN
jgi:hypothetical protein